MVLGDFNDVITGTSSATNPFYNFIADAEEYAFADMAIATGSDKSWSYPSYPSHIDHVLVSNELMPYIKSVTTLTPDLCNTMYYNNVSDHRPLMVTFE